MITFTIHIRLLLLLVSCGFASAQRNTFMVNRKIGFVRKSTSAFTSFVATSETQCIYKCVSPSTTGLVCKAVQYQENTGVCTIYTGCAPLQLQAAVSTTTYLSLQTTTLTSSTNAVLTPIFDFMMTDSCGFSNQGTLMPNLTLTPTYFGSVTPWNFTYTPSMNLVFGNAILYPGLPQYSSISPPISFTLDLRINSLTLFGYYWLSTSVTNFALIEFGRTDVSYGILLWFDVSGLYYDLGLACSGNCWGFSKYYSPTIKSWTHAAVVYDFSAKKLTHYLNGSVVYVSGTTTFSNAWNLTSFLTAARSSNGKLPGTTACLKVYLAALTAEQINSIATSCMLGSVFVG